MVVDTPSVLLVPGRSPIRTLAQYLEIGRTQPLRWGSSGIGSSGHLLGAVLVKDGNAPRLDHVPYRGSAPGLQDMMAGVIESLIDPITTNMGMLRDGTLRALAVTSATRLAPLPDVPTFQELGLPRLTAGNWIGISGPRNLPAPIATRIMEEIPKLIARPDLLARFEELASYPPNPPMVGEAYARFIAAFAREWTEVAREANITAS
jgi:tripartite-type tricarboxylate transporter receptor subunit TctC